MAKEQRLIDIEPVKKFIVDGLNSKEPNKAFGHDAIEILAEIEYAPTVDAVEVVRCVECDHLRSGRNNFGVFFWCGNAAGLTNIYDPYKDYCPRGERRDKDAVD